MYDTAAAEQISLSRPLPLLAQYEIILLANFGITTRVCWCNEHSVHVQARHHGYDKYDARADAVYHTYDIRMHWTTGINACNDTYLVHDYCEGRSTKTKRETFIRWRLSFLYLRVLHVLLYYVMDHICLPIILLSVQHSSCVWTQITRNQIRMTHCCRTCDTAAVTKCNNSVAAAGHEMDDRGSQPAYVFSLG